jgi:hypothetical protein
MKYVVNRARAIIAIAVCSVCLSGVATAQRSAATTAQVAPAATPEALTERYVAAMRQSDWNTVAGLMHPRALTAMRAFIKAASAQPDAKDFLTQVYGTASPEKLAALSDRDLFAKFLGTTLGSSPELGAALKSARAQVLGHVNEGADSAHVLYRMRMTIAGMEMTKVDVLSAARDGSGWRALLTADIENMIQRMKSST